MANMAGFDDLPNELVSEVLKFVLPEDLENFAQTSKHVLLLSKPFLETHRQLIRRYTIFNTYLPRGRNRDTRTQDEFSVLPIPILFKHILNERRIGHYIREIEFNDVLFKRFIYTCIKSLEEAQELYQQHYCDLIDSAVAQSKVPEVRDRHEHFKKNSPRYRYGGEDLLIALILPLLPNLNSLSMYWTGDDSFCYKIFPHGISLLSNVKTLNMKSCNGNLSTDHLRLFSSLPSLKSLTVHGRVSDGCNHIEYPLDSHITELVLLRCHFLAQRLVLYLDSFRNLQKFTYDRARSSRQINEEDHFDPVLIRSSIVAHAKATLQTLTILGPPRRSSFIGSLQVFGALREIRTEWPFLFPTESDLETWPSLVLPASLHTLQLRDQVFPAQDSGQYTAFIRGIQRAKETKCLHLEVVEVDLLESHAVVEPDDLNSLCKGLGMSLTFSAMHYDDFFLV